MQHKLSKYENDPTVKIVYIEKQTRTSSKALAAICALFLPGLGHLVKGYPFQAFFWFLFIFIGYGAFVVPGMLLHFLSVVDAGVSK